MKLYAVRDKETGRWLDSKDKLVEKLSNAHLYKRAGSAGKSAVDGKEVVILEVKEAGVASLATVQEEVAPAA